jgi:hypothetical protein
MKAILLAGVMALAFLLVMTASFRRWQMRQRAVFLIRLWLASVPILLAAYVLTPPSVWLLPGEVQDDPAWFGPIFCLGLWFAGFFGGIIHLYNLAERGMSLRMLIDVSEAGASGLDQIGMMSAYSRGQGIGWMYNKRLADLQEQRLVQIEAGTLIINPRGRSVARTFGRLRRLFGLGAWT